MQTPAAQPAPGVLPGRSRRTSAFWALGSAAALVAVTLLAGGTTADLVLAYWFEGVVMLGVSYTRILHSDGPLTEADLATLRKYRENDAELACVAAALPHLGHPLPPPVRRAVARDLLRVHAIFTAFIGVFVVLLAVNMFGGLTPDPLLWVLLALSVSAQHAYRLRTWLSSEEPAVASPASGTDAALVRTVLVFVVVWVGAAFGQLLGPVAGVILLTLFKGGGEEAFLRHQQRTPATAPRAPAAPPAGWYRPAGEEVLRWWDGESWTSHTHPLPGDGHQ